MGVYFLKAGERSNGRILVKIGKADNPASRLKQLQAGNLDLTEVGSVETDDAFTVEKYAKNMLIARRVGREIFELTDAELEDAIHKARTYVAEDLPLRGKVAALAKQQSDDELLRPGDRERNIHQSLLRARESKYLAEIDEDRWSNELKLVIGGSAGLADIATWKTETRTEFDEQAFKLAEPDLYRKYLRTSRRRTFRLTWTGTRTLHW